MNELIKNCKELFKKYIYIYIFFHVNIYIYIYIYIPINIWFLLNFIDLYLFFSKNLLKLVKNLEFY